MKKRIALTVTVLAVAGGLALGGTAGAAVTASGPVGWVREALGGLVADGTISETQADAVAEALDAARPARPWGPGPRIHAGGAVVAEALGMTPEELRSAWREGKTIAALAEERGVSVDAVVEALVEAQRERLERAVESGRLTRERADALLEDADERARAFVAGERPALRGPYGRGGGLHRHGHRGSGTPESGAEGTSA